jgi:signal peptide peptidase SppA
MQEPSDETKSRWAAYLEQIPWLNEFIAPKEKIAIIRMAGVIADSSVIRRAGINHNKYREAIAQAFEAKRVRAIALILNSPGGAPAQCSLISAHIRRLAAEKNIPVFAFVEDVAASGGYWLACAADEIYAQGTSIVGSIGVISAGFGFDRLIEKYDVTRRVHTSGKDKAFLDPFRPEKSDDVQRLKDIQADMHAAFKEWVHERRGARLNGAESELMEGAFWTGAGALQRGLIDGIGDAGSVLREKFGPDIKFVDFIPEKKSLLSAFLPISVDSMLDPGAIIDAAQEKTFWGRFGL